MEKLSQCQKRALFNRNYDEKMDTMYYRCVKKSGCQHIIAVDCKCITDDDIKANADYNALAEFKSQCCKDYTG